MKTIAIILGLGAGLALALVTRLRWVIALGLAFAAGAVLSS